MPHPHTLSVPASTVHKSAQPNSPHGADGTTRQNKQQHQHQGIHKQQQEQQQITIQSGQQNQSQKQHPNPSDQQISPTTQPNNTALDGTSQQNNQQQQKQLPQQNSSDYICVHYNKERKKWVSQIYHNNKQHFLGYYSLETDAALAFDECAKLLRGSNAKTNFATLEDYEKAKKDELAATGLSSDVITSSTSIKAKVADVVQKKITRPTATIDSTQSTAAAASSTQESGSTNTADDDDSRLSKTSAAGVNNTTKKGEKKVNKCKSTKKRFGGILEGHGGLVSEQSLQPNDVLCGRGGHIKIHPGNVQIRTLAKKHRKQYKKALRFGKQAIAKSLVKTVRKGGGRFMKEAVDQKGMWEEIGDVKATAKFSQLLRDNSETRGLGIRKTKKQKTEDDVDMFDRTSIYPKNENEKRELLRRALNGKNVEHALSDEVGLKLYFRMAKAINPSGNSESWTAQARQTLDNEKQIYPVKKQFAWHLLKFPATKPPSS